MEAQAFGSMYHTFFIWLSLVIHMEIFLLYVLLNISYISVIQYNMVALTKKKSHRKSLENISESNGFFLNKLLNHCT